MFEKIQCGRHYGRTEEVVKTIFSILSKERSNESLIVWVGSLYRANELADRIRAKHPNLVISVNGHRSDFFGGSESTGNRGECFYLTIRGDAKMIITKVTISVNELRKSAEFENQRFEASYEASVEPGESVKDVEDALIKYGKEAIDRYFEEDPDTMKREIRRLRKLTGSR